MATPEAQAAAGEAAADRESSLDSADWCRAAGDPHQLDDAR